MRPQPERAPAAAQDLPAALVAARDPLAQAVAAGVEDREGPAAAAPLRRPLRALRRRPLGYWPSPDNGLRLPQVQEARPVPVHPDASGPVRQRRRRTVRASRSTSGRRSKSVHSARDCYGARAGADQARQQRAAARVVSDGWMSAPEAARRLGVQLHTLHGMIDRGELPAEVVRADDRPKRRRSIRVRRQDVGDFIERARVKPGELRHLHPNWSWERYG